MGNLSLLRFKNVYDIPYVARYKRVYQAFQINPAELKKFHNMFASFDTDHSGEIDLQEFFRHLEVGSTPFGDRIFHIMDEDGSGQIDFREFVMSLWNYCTLTSATLELFAFDLYDTDSTGELSVEEVHQMLQDMYGSEVNRNQQARGIASDLLKKGTTGKFNIDMFHEFVHYHPAFLFPAFRLQLSIQTYILGTRYWEKASEKRLKLSNGKFIRFSELLRMNVNKGLYEDQITRHHINDTLVHFSSKEKVLEGMTHESKAHEAAALILHYTGTHHYRQKVSKIDKKHSPLVNLPNFAAADPNKPKYSFLTTMKGLLLGTVKEQKKKQYEVKHPPEVVTAHTTERSAKKKTVRKVDEDEEVTFIHIHVKAAEGDDFEETFNLMRKMKFEGKANAKDPLHSDMLLYQTVVDQSHTKFIDPPSTKTSGKKRISVHTTTPMGTPLTGTPFITPSTSPTHRKSRKEDGKHPSTSGKLHHHPPLHAYFRGHNMSQVVPL